MGNERQANLIKLEWVGPWADGLGYTYHSLYVNGRRCYDVKKLKFERAKPWWVYREKKPIGGKDQFHTLKAAKIRSEKLARG